MYMYTYLPPILVVSATEMSPTQQQGSAFGKTCILAGTGMLPLQVPDKPKEAHPRKQKKPVHTARLTSEQPEGRVLSVDTPAGAAPGSAVGFPVGTAGLVPSAGLTLHQLRRGARGTPRSRLGRTFVFHVAKCFHHAHELSGFHR